MEADTGVVVYYAWLNSTEKTIDYEAAVDTLEGLGYLVQAVIIDGRKGVRQALLARDILVQHCQFHQAQTVTQCLTKRPQLIQNQELRAISLSLARTTEHELQVALESWHARHAGWLKERYLDESGRLRYRHARTRRAYFSLIHNLPFLFTHQLQPETKAVSNTTNRLDGQFGVWKTALKQHRGCSKQLKTTILCSFFSRTTDGDSN